MIRSKLQIIVENKQNNMSVVVLIWFCKHVEQFVLRLLKDRTQVAAARYSSVLHLLKTVSFVCFANTWNDFNTMRMMYTSHIIVEHLPRQGNLCRRWRVIVEKKMKEWSVMPFVTVHGYRLLRNQLRAFIVIFKEIRRFVIHVLRYCQSANIVTLR